MGLLDWLRRLLRVDDSRRFVWRVLAMYSCDIPKSVWSVVASSGSSYARITAAQNIPVGDWTMGDWQACLSEQTNPDPRVRRVWLLRLLSRTPPPTFASDLYYLALLDSSSIVRDVAIYAVRKRLEMDPALFYRQKINSAMLSDSSKTPEVWAFGLAAVGAGEDIPWYRKWLATKNSKLRAAGLIGLARINSEDVSKIALELLGDEQRASRLAAARWLMARKDPNQIDSIRNCFARGGRATRRTAFRVLLDLGGMGRIIDIFAALPDDDLRSTAWDAFVSWAYIYGWHARSASAPYKWHSLDIETRNRIIESWDYLLSEYAFDPPQEPKWTRSLLPEYPIPKKNPDHPRAHLGPVPYEAWKNWSHFPCLLDELTKR